MLTFRHSGNLGDIIYSLPTVLDLLARNNQEQARYLIRPDEPANYSAAGPHPLVNKKIDRDFASKLLPLLRSQAYIGEAGIWEGQPFDYCLDRFRETGFDFSKGSIVRYYALAFLCTPDASCPWLDVEPSPEFAGKLLVNRTERYRHTGINYQILSDRPDVVFVGLPREYRVSGVRGVPHVEAPDFLTLARWIRGAKGFIGNQSFGFALAEAMKVPRLLEVFRIAPNVIVTGAEGYEAFSQGLFDEIVKELAK